MMMHISCVLFDMKTIIRTTALKVMSLVVETLSFKGVAVLSEK